MDGDEHFADGGEDVHEAVSDGEAAWGEAPKLSIPAFPLVSDRYALQAPARGTR